MRLCLATERILSLALSFSPSHSGQNEALYLVLK